MLLWVKPVQHNLLFATDNNGIQSQYPGDWAHHPGTFSKQHFLDMTHSNASYVPCYLGHRQHSLLDLCMYTPSQLHQPAILHFDECYIRKQNECLMIQQEHTILVFECKTWKIRFLCRDICLRMHCTVLIGCTEPIPFVCAHFNRNSHSPSFQTSADCIHHLHRNFRLDWEFLVEVFYLFFGTGFARIPPTFFNSWAVWIKYSLISNCLDGYSSDHSIMQPF